MSDLGTFIQLNAIGVEDKDLLVDNTIPFPAASTAATATLTNTNVSAHGGTCRWLRMAILIAIAVIGLYYVFSQKYS